MTKELRGFINRARKAQDRIFNSKKDDRIAIHINMSSNGFCGIDAYRHDEESHNVIDSYHFRINPWSTAEEIEKGFKRLSLVIDFDI